MTLQEAYTILDNFVKDNEVWSAVIFVAVAFWATFIFCLIFNRKALVEELEWHR